VTTTQALHKIIALDVGAARVGVAIASSFARLPSPLMTMDYNKSFWDNLKKVCDDERVDTIVVGLPRGLDGHETAQTKLVRKFTDELERRLNLPIHFQDEALTSKKAEAELVAKGKKFNKAMVDALAATYILEDFLISNQERKNG
jgi:putative Holliday junction resolvase